MKKEICSENELEFSISILLAFSVVYYSSHCLIHRNPAKSSPSIVLFFRSCHSFQYHEIPSFLLFYLHSQIYARIRSLYYSFLF